MRATEALINDILRLDYETFVNASFFLQGKADQFTQQRPADRKRILSSILGLEVWEAYRKETADQRRTIEKEITGLDGRLNEISTELERRRPAQNAPGRNRDQHGRHHERSRSPDRPAGRGPQASRPAGGDPQAGHKPCRTRPTRPNLSWIPSTSGWKNASRKKQLSPI